MKNELIVASQTGQPRGDARTRLAAIWTNSASPSSPHASSTWRAAPLATEPVHGSTLIHPCAALPALFCHGFCSPPCSGLAGCATPQMQTSVRFVPPADAAGRACVAGCEAARTNCQAQCQTAYAQCAKMLDADVEAQHAESAQAIRGRPPRRYAAELQQYQLDMRLGWVHAWPIRHPYRHPVLRL